MVVKTGSRKAHEVEKTAMYESRFKETIDYVMLRALDKSVAARTDAALGKRSTAEESTLQHVCVILYCPDGEPKDEAIDEFAVRVTNNMTFRDLRVNAARQHARQWPGSPQPMRPPMRRQQTTHSAPRMDAPTWYAGDMRRANRPAARGGKRKRQADDSEEEHVVGVLDRTISLGLCW